LLQARKEQVSAGRKSEATFGFYREKTGHWLRVLGEDFPLAQLSATDVDRYITHRRSEWSVPPRAPVLDQPGNVLKPARSGRHVTDHTIAKELVALRAALKLAKRRGIWKGDPAEVLPVGFAPEYKPFERFLTYDELEALLGELLEDAAARVAFTIATSAEAAATERALREDVSPDRLFVQGARIEACDPLAQGADRGELAAGAARLRARTRAGTGWAPLPAADEVRANAGACLRPRRHPALHAK
jgi:site-specific recombinase XerD